MLLTVAQIAEALERSWTHSLPGRECCERDNVLRELRQLLRPVKPRPALRLVSDDPGAL
jgi:hypothetical protein